MVTRNSAVIGLPGEQEQDFYETPVLIDLPHVVHLEPLEGADKLADLPEPD